MIRALFREKLLTFCTNYNKPLCNQEHTIICHLLSFSGPDEILIHNFICAILETDATYRNIIRL